MKSVDNGAMSLDRPHRLLDDETTSSYQSPSSLSSTSDADTRSPATWHTPRGSPKPPDDTHTDPLNPDRVNHPGGDDGPDPAAVSSLSGDVVDKHSSPVAIPLEPESSDVTASATERETHVSSKNDVESGEFVYRC